MDYTSLFTQFKEPRITGRYITPDHILGLFYKSQRRGKTTSIGQSVNGLPIHAYHIGTGPTRILMWSQMHGNETTSTKALFDLFNFLDGDSANALHILERVTFCFIPLLNPDGALAYTRENAAGVDLNRDFVNFTQPESTALEKIFTQFNPHYCYNLHDQRTIFGVGETSKPATMSFLAPAFNQMLDFNATRLKAVDIIIAMNRVLQNHIPGHIGRFDDSYNAQCAGDHYQAKVPTILIEAGHYPDDYNREQVRFYFFVALLTAIESSCENDVVISDITEYHAIPQNSVSFYDIVYKNVKIIYDTNEIITNFASQYREELIDGEVCFNAYIERIGNLDRSNAHTVIDAAGRLFSKNGVLFPEIGLKADFMLGNDSKVVNGLIKTAVF